MAHRSYRPIAIAAALSWTTVTVVGLSPAMAADPNPSHVAPGISSTLATFADGAQVRLVWVQKQFVSDDTTRYLDCGTSYVNWLYNGGTGTRLIGYDSREATGRILDSSTATHVKPVIDRTGNFIFWNELAASRSWVMSWDGSVKKTLISGGEYIVLCTWYEKASGKEYVYVAGFQRYDEYLLTARNVYRYEFDLTTASVKTATKTLMWNKSNLQAPFNVAADGVTAGGNLPWPDAHIAALPNGTLTRVNAAGAWSCHANIAPDASSRFFHMEDAHRQIAVYGPSHTNPAWIPIVTKLPGADATADCNAPRWTNDVRFLTVFAPYEFWGIDTAHDCTKPVFDKPWREGESGEIYFGKFNAQFNDAQFIRITDGDWRFRKIQGEAWVSTGEGPVSTQTASVPSRVGARPRVRVTQQWVALDGAPGGALTLHGADGRIVRSSIATTGDAVVSLDGLAQGVYTVRWSGLGASPGAGIVVR